MTPPTEAVPGGAASYAGRVVFPRSPADLIDPASCPACFTPVTVATCSECGLDLLSPHLDELAATSADAVVALDRRLELIGLIRWESAESAKAAEATATAVAASVRAAAVAASAAAILAEDNASVAIDFSPAIDTSTAPPSYPSRNEPTAASAPRRSSVQVVLLIVGVALLSVAAIFFLVYAFITYGILVRSAIIAAITIASFITASLLKRRGLAATAEGIAVFSAVLLYLDSFAVRANSLFNAQTVAPLSYWGATLVIAAVALLLWNRFSALRAASVVGFASLPVGIGLIAGALTPHGSDGPFIAFVIFLVTAAAALIHPLAPRLSALTRPPTAGEAERAIVLATAAIAVIAGFLFVWAASPADNDSPVPRLVLLAVVALAHVLVGSRFRGEASVLVTALVGAIAVVGGATLALVGVGISAHDDKFENYFLWPALVAVVVTLVADAARQRIRQGDGWRESLRSSLRLATVGSGVIGILAALLPVGALVFAIAGSVAGAFTPAWGHAFLAHERRPEPVYVFSMIALTGILLVGWLLWAASGRGRARFLALVWSSLFCLVAVVALLPANGPQSIVWLLIGALATTAFLARVRTVRFSALPGAPLLALGIIALTLGYLTSWRTEITWPIATVVTLGALIGLRSAIAPPGDETWALPERIRAILLAPGTGLVFIAAAAGADELRRVDSFSASVVGRPDFLATVQAIDRLETVSAAGILLVIVARYLPWLTNADRKFLFWISAPVAFATMLTALAMQTGAQNGDYLYPRVAAQLGLSFGMLVALGSWATVRRAEHLFLERSAAALGMATALAYLVNGAASLTRLSPLTLQLGTVVSAIVVVAFGLVLVATRPTFAVPRDALDLGALAVTGWALLVAVSHSARWLFDSATPSAATVTWLVFLLASVVAAITAISTDGLFASASSRRHLGWLALALATGSLWWRLGDGGVTEVEPYTLPLAGALVLIAALIQWRGHPAEASTANKNNTNDGTTAFRLGVAPLVALAGFLIGIVPSALVSIDGAPTRAIILCAASAGLLLVGAWLRRTTWAPAAAQWCDIAVVAGVAGLLVTTVGRAMRNFTVTGSNDPGPDLWLLVGLTVLVLAAFGLVRPGPDNSANAVRDVASQVLVAAGLVAVVVREPFRFGEGEWGNLRTVVVITVFALAHIAASWRNRAPLTGLISWLALGLAAVSALVALQQAIPVVVELATLPVAIALLASGALRLIRSPKTRSWAALTPGVVVLLAPSLLADATEPPVWRLVALGAVAIGTLVFGLVRRLQAPFVLGAAATLIHAVATFSHEIRVVYESVPWWLWLGAGGLIIIVLAARYEQRLGNIRSVVRRVSALR